MEDIDAAATEIERSSQQAKSDEDQLDQSKPADDLLKAYKTKLRRVLRTSHELIMKYGDVFDQADNFCGLKPSVENVREVISMSHRLAYSTFAPYGYKMGDHLREFKPPVPQTAQFLASQLHDLDSRYQSGEMVLMKGEIKVEEKHSKIRDEIKEGTEAEIKDEIEVQDQETESEAKASEAKTEAKREIPTEPSSMRFVLNPDLKDMDDDSSSADSTDESSSSD